MLARGKDAINRTINKILLYFNFALHVEEFGVSESAADNTAAFNNAAVAAAANGKKLIISPGVYKTEGTINLGALKIDAAPGAVIDHRPPNDTTDCIVISGLDAGKTIISGLTIKGMQGGHGFGRDLIRMSKGDYGLFKDMYLVTPKRDGIQFRPTVSNQWIENIECRNVKVQFPQGTSSTPTATITSGATSFNLSPFSSTATTPHWPDAPFKVQCESEIMLVGAYDRVNAPNTFSSVTRGVNGTTAVSHTTSKSVTLISPKLAVGIDAVVDTFTLDWSSRYPEAPFYIKVENEIMLVGAINRTTHTLSSITRGVEGTTAATHAIDTSASAWVGRDGFHFEIGTSAQTTFINQVNFFNCESRTTPRHALMLQNDSIFANSAQKLSAYLFDNCEFAAADGVHDIVRIQGSPGDGGSVVPLIENIVFRGTTIECTSQPSPKRLGAGINITGRMSGLLEFKNSIIYGTTDHILGHQLFDDFDTTNLNTSAYTPRYVAHQGILDKFRSSYTLALNTTADVKNLIVGEILAVYVQDKVNKDNNQHFFGLAYTNGHYVHPVIDSTKTGSNVDFSAVPNKSVFFSTKCGTNGNVTITLDGTPFVVPVTTKGEFTPDQAAKTISEFTFTGFRALWNKKQTVSFTKPDGTAFTTFSVDYSTTGVNGTTSDGKSLRVINKHISETAYFEVMYQRHVKDTSN